MASCGVRSLRLSPMSRRPSCSEEFWRRLKNFVFLGEIVGGSFFAEHVMYPDFVLSSKVHGGVTLAGTGSLCGFPLFSFLTFFCRTLVS